MAVKFYDSKKASVLEQYPKVKALVERAKLEMRPEVYESYLRGLVQVEEKLYENGELADELRRLIQVSREERQDA